METIEDIIRKYVNFNHGVSGGGWNVVYCEVCGDGSRKKGPRGGFSFIDNGNTAFYHCFNCGCNENFSSLREVKFSKNMKHVLESFGIPKNEYNVLLLDFDKSKKSKIKSHISEYTTIEIPKYFTSLKTSNSELASAVKKYIKINYNLSAVDYSFYIVEESSFMDNKEISQFKNRVIIPFFKNGKMIYYQARDITGKAKNKYLSPNLKKSNILFNIDQLYRNTSNPLFVVEGPFDAIHVGGVATLANELSSQQIQLLKNSRREKVLIPDFGGDSNKMLEQFIDNNWKLSVPSYGKQCKDISSAVLKYGKLFTCYDIGKNVYDGDSGEIMFNMLNRNQVLI